jgi:ATP-dependent Clp protease ATP-binding subunit ClpA
MLAQEEAERMALRQVTSEHILIGLARVDDSVSQIVLNRLGVKYFPLREAVRSLAPDVAKPLPNTLELSEGTKLALQYGIEEARDLGHHHIGTEHLLLGVIRVNVEGESPLGRLEAFGVTAEAVQQMVKQVLQEPFTEQPQPKPWTQPMPNPQEPMARIASVEVVRDNMQIMCLVLWDDLVTFAEAVYEQLDAKQAPVRVDRAVGEFAVSLTFSNERAAQSEVPPQNPTASLTVVREELNMTCLLPWHDLEQLIAEIKRQRGESGTGSFFYKKAVGAYIVSVNVTGES